MNKTLCSEMKLGKDESKPVTANQKNFRYLGKYLFPPDFIKTNREILMKYLVNSKAEVRRGGLDRSRNPGVGGCVQQLSAVLPACKAGEKVSKKCLMLSFEEEDRGIKGGLQRTMGLKSKTESRASKREDAKNVAALLSDNKTATKLPALSPIHCSSKRHSAVEAYSAITHQGLVRNYNEDRVVVVTNIEKPYNKEVKHWPSVSFFGLYDGHGGAACAEYLRDHLHYFVKHP